MKSVYKILPVSLFDIQGFEQWLEEQADLGLAPTHLGSYARAYFLFFTTDPEAPELYSDLVTRGQSLDRLARKIKRAKVGRVLLPVIFILLILAALCWPASRFDVPPDRWAWLPIFLLSITNPLSAAFGCGFHLWTPRNA